MRAYLAPTETFVHNQITNLRRHRPIVLAHHRRPGTETELGEGVIADERLRPRLAAMERGAYRGARVALPSGVAALARYAREQDARLLHYHYLTDARFLLGVARRTGLPAIASAYGYDVTEFPHMYRGLGLRYLRAVFERLDCVLAMTEDMRDDVIALGCPPAKVEVHYHGSPTGRFRHDGRVYEAGAPLTVLCCARLEPIKGQDLVVEAMTRLAPRLARDVRVVFVGDGTTRDRLACAVREAGLEDRVTFAGHVPHDSPALVQHYARADVFVHPSITIRGIKEGIPGTIVEAMAAGLPVVATRHGGIPAVIDSGRDGLLVTERDVDALACAIASLLDEPQARERLGRAAAQRAQEQLDLAPRTAALERIYDRLA
jgi:colanic acid/amylovoran biosynthesis glycosyltransferase